MLRTIFILLIRLFRILFFLLLCLINSFFGTFEKTQLQIEHFLEHLAKWHCLERNFLFCVCTNTGVPLCIHLLYCHLSVVTLIFQFSPVNNPLSKNLFCSICQIVNEADGYLYVDKTKYNTDELVETGRLVFKNNCIQIEGFSNEAN